MILFYYYYFFYFTILYWFCHTSTCIHHGCTCVPNPEPSSHLPPHTIPLGHPSAPAPSFLYPASNLNWWFISYMILHMFQCHTPKSSPPPRQSPKEYIYFKILAHTAFFIRVQYISKILKEEIEPKVNWLIGLHLKTFGYFWSFDLCITPGMWDQVFGNPHTISTFSYPKSLAGHAIGIILGNS